MRLLAVLACLAVPGAAAAQAEAGFAATYICDGGVVVQAAYINPPGEPGFAVVLREGALVPMRAGPSGSGVRYVALDDSGLVWHAKGDDGFLASDRDGAQETLVAGCRRAED